MFDFIEKSMDTCKAIGNKLELEILGGFALILDVVLTIVRAIWFTQWPNQAWWQHALQFVQLYLGGFGYCVIGAFLILFSLEFVICSIDFLDYHVGGWLARRRGIKDLALKLESAATQQAESTKDTLKS